MSLYVVDIYIFIISYIISIHFYCIKNRKSGYSNNIHFKVRKHWNLKSQKYLRYVNFSEGEEANLKCNTHASLCSVLIIGFHRIYIASQISSLASKISLRKVSNIRFQASLSRRVHNKVKSSISRSYYTLYFFAENYKID